MEEIVEYIIKDDFDGARLDRYLRKKFDDVPMGMIFKYLRTGKIKVNGKKSKENYRLKRDDIITTFFESANKEDKKVRFINLNVQEKELVSKNIIFENNDVLVFNKPSEMVMHKGSGFSYGITEMMKSYLKNNDFAFANRIDKSTSGLIIGGKNLPTLRKLTELIRDRNVSKYYYVVVKGNVNDKQFSIKNYLYNNGKKIIAYESERNGAKYAETKFEVISEKNGFTILKAELITGRKHQLRVQLASNQLPIVGDRKYGVRGSERMCLFSYKLKLEELKIEVEQEIPEFFMEILKD